MLYLTTLDLIPTDVILYELIRLNLSLAEMILLELSGLPEPQPLDAKPPGLGCSNSNLLDGRLGKTVRAKSARFSSEGQGLRGLEDADCQVW
jgi:hypothetical protein